MSDHEESFEERAQKKFLDNMFDNSGKDVEKNREDGVMSKSLDDKKGLGIIQTMITATENDEDYRQIIKRARWTSQEHRDKYVKAINACIITGSKNALRHLLDMITAESAGDNGIWAREALEGLTHTTFTSRSDRTGGGGGWWKKHDNSL